MANIMPTYWVELMRTMAFQQEESSFPPEQRNGPHMCSFHGMHSYHRFSKECYLQILQGRGRNPSAHVLSLLGLGGDKVSSTGHRKNKKIKNKTRNLIWFYTFISVLKSTLHKILFLI